MINYLTRSDLERSSQLWKRLPFEGRRRQLPIYFQDQAGCRIYYSPGYVGVVPQGAINSFESNITSNEPSLAGEVATSLVKYALMAMRKKEELLSQTFIPISLTLYLNNQCNLNCSYCFSNAQIDKGGLLEITQVEPAMKLVAHNCRIRSAPFMLVFHGGGEPTVNMSLIKSIITLANQTAEKNELKPYYYLATNGVLSIKNAQWISKNFQKIGISCDGPGFIQDRQRPRQNHLGSSRYVEQTVSIIRDAGAQFAVRVTVTPDSLFYMEEIAEYICTVLKPDEIHIEPIYYGGRAQKINNYLFSPSEAHNFLENYFNAQRIATKHGIPWLTSGSRLEDIHGPYCNTLRNVLNLIPGGCATACFKASTIEECISKDMVVGSSTKNMTGDDYFEINHNKVQKINKNILDSSNSTKCADCFNKYHCVRTCPDRCLLEKTENSDTSEFRCFFQKLLSTRIILESANHFMNEDFFKQDIIGGAVSSIQQSP